MYALKLSKIPLMQHKVKGKFTDEVVRSHSEINEPFYVASRRQEIVISGQRQQLAIM